MSTYSNTAKGRVVFFGNERIATAVSTTAPTLRALLTAGYEIAAVVANHEVGRSRRNRLLEIAEVAQENNIPVLLPNKPIDIIEQLQAYKADIGVLVAYGRIIPQKIIDVFPHGIINIHPSLLPKHRGPTPIESVILDGSTTTGVSIMQLAREMDAGPVFRQVTVKLMGHESKQQLADQLLEQGSQELVRILPQILRDEATPTPQTQETASYDQLLNKEDGRIDWNQPAATIERQIRAYLGWPSSYTTLAGREVIITKAHPAPETGPVGNIHPSKAVLQVYTAEGSIVIDQLKPAGKTEMSGSAFLAGYGKLL